MKRQIRRRLAELQTQRANMEQQIAELQQMLMYGQQNLLAVSGAIQELEQLLQPKEETHPDAK